MMSQHSSSNCISYIASNKKQQVQRLGRRVRLWLFAVTVLILFAHFRGLGKAAKMLKEEFPVRRSRFKSDTFAV